MNIIKNKIIVRVIIPVRHLLLPLLARKVSVKLLVKFQNAYKPVKLVLRQDLESWSGVGWWIKTDNPSRSDNLLSNDGDNLTPKVTLNLI